MNDARDTAAPGEISLVVIALNEGARLRQTVEQARATLPPGSEIVGATRLFFARRQAMAARRTRDSRWYFDRFPVDW